jgi:uncharacterized protein (DUF58 family)
MIRLTARGVALLAVALAAYVAARVFGTWELYLIAFAFPAVVVGSWVLVVAGGRQLPVVRAVAPSQPLAGDPLLLTVRVRPGVVPWVWLTLFEAAGDLADRDRPIELESLGPRPDSVTTRGPWRARRGVYHVPPAVAVAEDPLGLVYSRRRLGDTLDVTVGPRLTKLPACPLVAGVGARDEGGGRRLPALNAAEFRGIRPHYPGEPLNRVDWKATAKTGSLMLRETEAATDRDITLLLNGAPAQVDGEREETNFELAVRAAGSLADHALRTGRGVTLLLPENEWRPIRLAPGEGSHRALLEILAGVTPQGLPRLGHSLRAIVGGPRAPLGQSRSRAKGLTLVLVVLALDPALVRSLLALRKEGRSVSVVHVDGGSFAAAPAAASLSLRLSLSAAGIRHVTVGPGDDLRAVLSMRPEGALARV